MKEQDAIKKINEKSKTNSIMMNDLHKRNDECKEKLFKKRERGKS